MNDSKLNISGLVLLAVIGLFVAAGAFLFTFITTQKAKTPDPRSNLRIPVPTIPARASITPLTAPLQVEILPTPDATLSANPTPTLETSPVDENEPLSSPSL